jgi:hypothetical protein
MTAVVRHMHTALAARRGGKQHITAHDYVCAKSLYASAVVLLARMGKWPASHEMGDAAMLVAAAVRLTIRIAHDDERGADCRNFADVCVAAGCRIQHKEDYLDLLNAYERLLLNAIGHRCHVSDKEAATAAACVADWLVVERVAQWQGALPDTDVENFARRLARPLEIALIKPPSRAHRHLLRPAMALTAMPRRPVQAAHKQTIRYQFKNIDDIKPVPEYPGHLPAELLSAAF